MYVRGERRRCHRGVERRVAVPATSACATGFVDEQAVHLAKAKITLDRDRATRRANGDSPKFFSRQIAAARSAPKDKAARAAFLRESCSASDLRAVVARATTCAMAMLRVANCPSQDLALTNAAFVNEADAAFVPYAELGDLVLFTRPHPDVERGTIALNGVQRKLLRVSTGDSLRVEPFTLPSSQFNAAAMTVELEFTKLRTATDLNAAGRHEQVRTASWRKANAGRGRAPKERSLY